MSLGASDGRVAVPNVKEKRLIINNRYPGGYCPYPAEYKAAIHGPYDPSRYYGLVPRQSTWDVKLGDIPKKLTSCDRRVSNFYGIVSRWIHRYSVRHVRVQMPRLNFFMQISAMVMIMSYWCSYGLFSPPLENAGGYKHKMRRYRYHW